MATTVNNNGSGRTPTTFESVLRSAWARLLMYDESSSSQKKRYQQTRKWVIYFWFAASALAVIKAVFAFEEVALWGPEVGGYIEGGLQLLIVAVSAAGVAIMSWGLQFANSVTWIEYRTSAEQIRSQIYLFRTNSGEYFNLPTEDEKRARLLLALNDADRRIPEGIGLPSSLMLPTGDKIQQHLDEKAADEQSATSREGFFSKMTVDEYIEARLKAQIKWYTGRVTNDIQNTERYQQLALGVAALGTILAALGYGFEAFVALTTSGGIALSMWGNIRMYGATYFIFRQTANDLQDHLDRWTGLDPQQRTEEAARQFVETAEKLFLRENEEWRKQSIQMQTANEQSLLKNMQMSGVKLPPIAGSEEAIAAAQMVLQEAKAAPAGEMMPEPAIEGAKGVEQADQATIDQIMDPASNTADVPATANGTTTETIIPG